MKEIRLSNIVFSFLGKGQVIGQIQRVEVYVVDGEVIGLPLHLPHEPFSLVNLSPEERSILEGALGEVTATMARQLQETELQLVQVQSELTMTRDALNDAERQIEELTASPPAPEGPVASVRPEDLGIEPGGETVPEDG